MGFRIFAVCLVASHFTSAISWASEIVAFDGNTSVITWVTTAQNNIWNGWDPNSLSDPNGPGLVGPDVTEAINGFTQAGNFGSDPTKSIPLGGDPNTGTAFMDFAGGAGNATNGRGTVYAFDVPAGTYTMTYDASWNSTASQVVVDGYIYDTTVEPTDQHRFDFVSGNFQNFYDDLNGIDPNNVLPYRADPNEFDPNQLVEGVELIFDNGVITGGGAVSTTTSSFDVAEDELVVFRIAGVGFGDDNSEARLNLLKLTLQGILGDFDGDGDVDGPDFLAWQRGESPIPLSASDLNDWETNYGVTSLSSAGVAVPEPPGMILGFFAWFIGCLSRVRPTKAAIT